MRAALILIAGLALALLLRRQQWHVFKPYTRLKWIGTRHQKELHLTLGFAAARFRPSSVRTPGRVNGRSES